MQVERSHRLAWTITSTLTAVIAVCITLSIYAAGLIWPDHPPSMDVYALPEPSATGQTPPLTAAEPMIETVEVHDAPAPFLVAEIAKPFGSGTDIGQPITIPASQKITRRPLAARLSGFWTVQSFAPQNDLTITAALDWPQQIDHHAVLAVTRSLTPPQYTTEVAVGTATDPMLPSVKPAMLPAPIIQTAALSDVVRRSPPVAVITERPERVAQSPTPPGSSTPAAIAPTKRSLHTPARLGYGDSDQVAVLGVFQSKSNAWALLELNDGRIVKAIRGSDLNAFKVSRIRGDKVWIRTGGTEKGLSVGQVFNLN
ncbi:hypothetical protein [Aliiroseovarius sp. 2305UL8-7]|uniref:hypothetical protein n=1 Tax=Aliiroseovarius conchicola TaxID=3121637 RepID=UPI00352846FC